MNELSKTQETSLEEDINKQLEKGLKQGKLCGFGFDELRGLK